MAKSGKKKGDDEGEDVDALDAFMAGGDDGGGAVAQKSGFQSSLRDKNVASK